MDWRKWAYERLLAPPPLQQMVADRIYGDGSIEGQPGTKPFLLLAFGPRTPELNDGDAPAAYSQTLTVWAHDDPGTYEIIDNILDQVRTALVGQVVLPGAHGCTWQGDSTDLADDVFATITRNSSYRLVGGY